MGYRAPVEGLQRRLAALEEELAGLRTAPPPTAAEQKKNRKRSQASKTVRALEKRLATLDDALVEAGCRDLTPREASYFERSTRIGVALIALGLMLASVHLVARSRLEMTWAECTCTIFEEEEDVHVARYEWHGTQRQFSASGLESGRVVRCWVPEPPSIALGHFERPPSSKVRFVERLSWTWLLTAGSSVVLGILVMVFARMEAENRRRGIIESNDFSSSSD